MFRGWDLLRCPGYAVPLLVNLTGSVWFFVLIGGAGGFFFFFLLFLLICFDLFCLGSWGGGVK